MVLIRRCPETSSPTSTRLRSLRSEVVEEEGSEVEVLVDPSEAASPAVRTFGAMVSLLTSLLTSSFSWIHHSPFGHLEFDPFGTCLAACVIGSQSQVKVSGSTYGFQDKEDISLAFFLSVVMLTFVLF